MQLQEMTAKSLVEARKTAGGCDGDDGSSCDGDGDSDGDDSSGSDIEKALTSTMAWTKPLTAEENLKKLEKRDRQLKKVATKRKRKQEEKEKEVRKARRQNMSEGQGVQATLLSAECWVSAFEKLTIPALTALGTSLGIEKVPKTPKSAVADAVKPAVQEWMDSRRATRAGTAGASE